MASIRKKSTHKGICYVIDYYDEYGLRRRLTFYEDYATVKMLAHEIELQKNRIIRGHEILAKDNVPLAKAIMDYIRVAETQKDHKTIKREMQVYRSIRGFLGDGMLIGKITLNRLEEYVHKRYKKDGLSEATVSIEIRTLRRFFNHLIEHGYLRQNPTNGLKGPKKTNNKKRPLTIEEIHKLLDVIDSPDYKDLVSTYINTGARRAELLPPLFSWDNVDFENGVVKLIGKRQKITYVPMNDELRNTLHRRKYIEKKKIPFEMNYEYMFKKIKKYYRKIGINDGNIHTFRRTFGSLLSQNGVEIFRVSTLLGHSDVKVTTDHYSTLSDENLVASVKVLDDLLWQKK